MQKGYEELPITVKTLVDGEHFGELSLINQHRVHNTTPGTGLDFDSLGDANPEFEPRKATCVSVETTDLLVID